jgi:hypothetical protein
MDRAKRGHSRITLECRGRTWEHAFSRLNVFAWAGLVNEDHPWALHLKEPRYVCDSLPPTGAATPLALSPHTGPFSDLGPSAHVCELPGSRPPRGGIPEQPASAGQAESRGIMRRIRKKSPRDVRTSRGRASELMTGLSSWRSALVRGPRHHLSDRSRLLDLGFGSWLSARCHRLLRQQCRIAINSQAK